MPKIAVNYIINPSVQGNSQYAEESVLLKASIFRSWRRISPYHDFFEYKKCVFLFCCSSVQWYFGKEWFYPWRNCPSLIGESREELEQLEEFCFWSSTMSRIATSMAKRIMYPVIFMKILKIMILEKKLSRKKIDRNL